MMQLPTLVLLYISFFFFFFSIFFVSFRFVYIVLGCSHNNTRFANGSHVPTAEPCLSCKCINANLICALRVCPEQVFPPPRGCVIVQKKNTCCPYMTCSKLHVSSLYNQDKKVITHDRNWYEQNIRNRIFSQNVLQRRIEDDDTNDELQSGDGRSKCGVFSVSLFLSLCVCFLASIYIL